MKTYNVTWEKYLRGRTEIQAENIEEAYKKFNETQSDVNVETDSEFDGEWTPYLIEDLDGKERCYVDALEPEFERSE